MVLYLIGKEKRSMRKSILLFVLIICSGVVLGQKEDTFEKDLQRVQEVFSYVNMLYVDSVPTKKLSEAAIVAMLEELDPHSTYVPAEEVESANERINGSFVGVGIRFNILKDTLLVVNTIPGGPSEIVGIRAGDKILEVDGEKIAGIGLKNSGVRKRLLGEEGSIVKITILRGKEKVSYMVTRDKIPVHSVITKYMIDDKVGYIKLTNFSRTTEEEVATAIKELKKEGMKDLIFDLQGNGGGLLSAAKSVADEFIKDNKLIVYSEGRVQPRYDLKADKKGDFEKGRLVILIDENAASASEIVAGAVQDWDRGLLVGRRTFGKGLVQRPVNLSDGSQIRLTIARYFTPSGRWIQKPYDDFDEYKKDYINRYEHGEMMHEDSIHFADSLMYKTLVTKRKVYGGGGIMPDIFVPLDTTEYSEYYRNLVRQGVLYSFAIDYTNNNRDEIKSKYPTIEDFNKNFTVSDDIMDELFNYANREDSTLVFIEEDYKISKDVITTRIKANIAQNIWDIGAFYQVYNIKNEIITRAYNALKDGTYDKEKLNHK